MRLAGPQKMRKGQDQKDKEKGEEIEVVDAGGWVRCPSSFLHKIFLDG